MRQRYLGLFAIVFIAMLGLASGLGLGKSGLDSAVKTTMVLPPTWTPTVTAILPIDPPQTTAKPATPELAFPDDIEATPMPSSNATAFLADVGDSGTPAVIQMATVAPPQIPSKRRGLDLRIDKKGPIALVTAEPLPSGAGSVPIRLQIPALNLDVPIEPMGWFVVEEAGAVHSQWQVVDQAAGHHIDSAYSGEAGNVVLSGHNNIAGSVFRTVCVIGEPGVDFGIGDDMNIVAESGQKFTYTVNGWQRMSAAETMSADQPGNAAVMQQTDHAQLTLITCWPPSSNTHRVIVTGLLTAY